MNDDAADGDADEAETFKPPSSTANPTQHSGVRRSGAARNRLITFAGVEADEGESKEANDAKKAGLSTAEVEDNDHEADDEDSTEVLTEHATKERTRVPSERIRRAL